MDAGLLGGLISAGATVIGAGGQAYASGKMNKRAEKFNREEAANQRAWNEKMQAQQNSWNMELWNKENEYNSPEAQVERLRAAGLNPLYYGLDGNGNASSLESAQALGYQRADAPNYANPLEGFGDIATKVAQVANIQADTAKKTQESLTEVQNREKIQAEIENTKQQYNNLVENEALTKVQRERAQKDLEWLDRINEATVGAQEAKTKLDSAQEKRILELLPGEKEMQKMSIEDFEHRWNKLDAEIANLAAQTGISKLDIENYALNHLSNGIMGSGISVQNIGKGLKGLAKKVKDITTKKAQDDSNYQGQGILAEDNR